MTTYTLQVLQRYAAIIFGGSGWIRASSDGFEITRKGAERAVENTGLILHTLDVSVKYDDETLGADMDESYTLEIIAPTAFLRADSVWGAMRGIETFSQLTAPCTRGWVCMKEVTKITDFPRFPYRGALVDSAKHFLPIDVLKQVLDGMASAKMNVLHWHLSDDESFPFVSEALPFAAEKGAFEDGDNLHMYTKLEVGELIEFARLRGIRVIPEFSTPGHTRSWGKGHPEVNVTLSPCPPPDPLLTPS
jgi:hexosaminidase